MKYIAVHMPLWKRRHVFEIVKAQLLHLNQELEGHGIALWPFFIHSPEDPDIHQHNDLHHAKSAIVTCENQYLSRS